MRMTLGLTLLGVVVLAGWHWQRPKDLQRPAGSTITLADPDLAASPSRREPVGWVFGRLIGYPGAERPLTGGGVMTAPRLASPTSLVLEPPR
jgi:hypothetical protein